MQVRLRARVKMELCMMMAFPAGVQDCVMKFGYNFFLIVETTT
jgi:hypothetical protein